MSEQHIEQSRQFINKVDKKISPTYLLEVQKDSYEWFFREGL